MYKWYESSAVCYIYLSDVERAAKSVAQEYEADGLNAPFRHSRWFSRGWTLQELIAPRKSLFFDTNWTPLGRLSVLNDVVAACTGIHTSVLKGQLRFIRF